MTNRRCWRFQVAVRLDVAAVITQLSNTIIRIIEQDRKVRELDEIEERLAELERRAENEHQRPAT
jgi:hypothetical protein